MFKLADDRVKLQVNLNVLSAVLSPLRPDNYSLDLLSQRRQLISNGYVVLTTIRTTCINEVITIYAIYYVRSVSLAQIVEVYLVTVSDMRFELTRHLEAYV